MVFAVSLNCLFWRRGIFRCIWHFVIPFFFFVFFIVIIKGSISESELLLLFITIQS